MSSTPNADDDSLGDEGSLVVEEQRFAVVPEWVIDADLSDAAFRVYSLLLRYGNGSGCRMPSRALLARRLHRSVDSIDRAMRELVSAKVVRVEHRRDGRVHLTNRYHVRTSPPQQDRSSEGGRTSAATVRGPRLGSRDSAATQGRTSAGRVAARMRPDRETSTDRTPPPHDAPSAGARSPKREEEVVLREYGISDLDELAQRCATARLALGRSVTRWSAACIRAAAQVAVKRRGWPAALVEPALLSLAADGSTASPMRLAEAGPWWDIAPNETVTTADEDLAELEARLDALDGARVRVQIAARTELREEGLPLTRATVLRRAGEILERQLIHEATA